MMTMVRASVEDPIDGWACRRHDGRDLVASWMEDKQRRGLKYIVLNTTEDLIETDMEQVDYVMGRL